MNVKVVLLPDGEDPDSFARKHNASQFSEFIKQSETDFIRFKTRLLLDDAGTDPIKRSALITDIIRTVAIIPDNIARSIYIRECSAMMEIDEQVLLNEVNKIRLSKEERQNMQGQVTPPVSNTMSMIPEYPDLPGYQPVAGDSFLPPDDTVPLPDDYMPPPPPPEEYPMEETGPMDVPPPDYPPAQPPQTVQPVQPVQTGQPKRSRYSL